MSVISYSVEVVTWRDIARDSARVTISAIDGVARRTLARVGERMVQSAHDNHERASKALPLR